MDMESESNLGESSSTFVYRRGSLTVVNPALLSPTCALCHRTLSSDNEIGDLEAINVCGDCKFLLLEDLETTSPDVYTGRTRISRRRQNQSIFERDSVDGDGGPRLERNTSSRATPSGSRQWRRGFSDTESDGFDSVYGESESNASLRRYWAVHGEADIAYGGDSDASIDGRSFLENENFGHLNGESDLDIDTDIDPMNAGLYQWNSEDDSEWEEADSEGNTFEPLRSGAQPQGQSLLNGNNAYINWRRQSLSPEVEGMFPLRRRERMQAQSGDLLPNFEEAQDYLGDFGDYLDARGFGDLLEHLAETESSRRGAPPASVSFVNNMPRLTIDDDKLDGMACAICKDSFTVGIVVNKLPCSHLYHPACIMPWLNARNTCPLCRYELPTDDKDYEARKRNVDSENMTFHIHQPDMNDDSFLDATYDAALDEPSQLDHGREQSEVVDADSVRENHTRDVPRNRWFFLAAAAAPIVSMVGISLLLWFSNPSARRLCQSGRIPYRRENSQRRWWSFF